METFFEILLVLIVMSFVLRKLAPYLLLFFLKRIQKKMRNNFESNFKTNFNFNKEKNEKELKIDSDKDKIGEYIDYEEID